MAAVALSFQTVKEEEGRGKGTLPRHARARVVMGLMSSAVVHSNMQQQPEWKATTLRFILQLEYRMVQRVVH